MLKSSYGADGLRVPMAFNGFCGQFKELPRRKSLSDAEYDVLIENVSEDVSDNNSEFNLEIDI